MAKLAYIEKRISADRLALIEQANAIIEGREVLNKVADNYEAVAEFVQVNKKKKK